MCDFCLLPEHQALSEKGSNLKGNELLSWRPYSVNIYPHQKSSAKCKKSADKVKLVVFLGLIWNNTGSCHFISRTEKRLAGNKYETMAALDSAVNQDPVVQN